MKNKILPCIIGIITGIANGFLGSGGGTVVVPCLEKFSNYTAPDCYKCLFILL